MRGRILLASPGLALALALPWPAGATSCALPTATPASVHLEPGDGSTGVPTDSLLWIRTQGAVLLSGAERLDAVHLEGADGAEIPLVEALDAGDLGLFAVAAEGGLPAGERLRFRVDPEAFELFVFDDWSDVDDPDDAPADEVEFVVGDGPSGAPPPPPAVLQENLSSDAPHFAGLCGSGYSDHARFLTDAEGAWLLARRAGTGDDGPWEDTWGLSSTAILDLHGDLGPGQAMDLDFGAVDLAGQFSGWAPTHHATMPLAGASCERSFDASLLLPFGFLLPIRRRRRAP